MANTPKPPKVGGFLPGLNPSGGGGWGIAPKSSREDPLQAQNRGASSYQEVEVDSVDIISVRDNSQVAVRGRWRAGHADPEHVAISRSNLDELGDEVRTRLRELLEERLPTFHEFINGEVAPSIVSDLLLNAEQIILSNSHYETIEHFLGRNAMEGDYISQGEYGIFALPGDDYAAAIARRLGWDADAFTNLVHMARIANHEKWIASGDKGLPWSTVHMERLYRMLRLLQEKVVIPDADVFVQMMFGRNGTGDRITMQDLICIYGKAVAEDLDFFDIVETLLNATWGDEAMLVSKKSGQGEFPTGTEWYADERDHMYVHAKGLAEIAASHMHGADREVSVAAVNYSILGEQHLHGVGPSEGRYDFYIGELFRKEARKDFQLNPEMYYDGVKPKSEWTLKDMKKGDPFRNAVLNEERALARLREIFAGTDFEDEAAKITDVLGFMEPQRALFRDMSLDVSWVEDVGHYARATLYALLSVARFNQAGEEAMRSDPDFARVSFSLARHMITVYEERSIVLQYLSGPIRDGVINLIIQPFDMLMFNKLFDRIKRNQRKLASRVKPPQRKR